MTSPLHPAAGAAAFALALACGGLAAAQPAAPRLLSDEQMDRVAAGAHATAAGDGQAAGQETSIAAATLTSYVSPVAGGGGAGAAGQVSASATAGAAAIATASSTLSISVSF